MQSKKMHAQREYINTKNKVRFKASWSLVHANNTKLSGENTYVQKVTHFILFSFLFFSSFRTLVKNHHKADSRSQSNINVVYCNCKEITSNYSVITEHYLSHGMLNVGGTYIKIFVCYVTLTLFWLLLYSAHLKRDKCVKNCTHKRKA